MTTVDIKLKNNGETVVQGRIGWPVTPFEGNYYVQKNLIVSGKFVPNYMPGFCPYKFFYIWMDYITSGGDKIKNLAWMYFFPNPIFPFIWFRIGLSQNHPELIISETMDPA